MDIQALLGLLAGEELGDLASQLKVDNSEAKKGLATALPTILEALNRNTTTTDGAESLDKALTKDHDGSILNDVAGYLNNPNLSEGAGILGHLFGGNTQNVASAISKSSGMNTDSSVKMLQMLAPLVMGALGQVKKENNLNASGLNGFISMLNSGLNSGNSSSGLMSVLSSVLDSNKDGQIADDLLNLAGNFFAKK